jgi:hypothetical protein
VPRLLAVVSAAALFSGCSNKSDSPKGPEWDILNQEFMDLYRAGNCDCAMTVTKKSLKVAERNAGPDHPDVAGSLNNLAEPYRTQGNYAQARPLFVHTPRPSTGASPAQTSPRIGSADPMIGRASRLCARPISTACKNRLAAGP